MARDKSQESDQPSYSDGLFNGLEVRNILQTNIHCTSIGILAIYLAFCSQMNRIVVSIPAVFSSLFLTGIQWLFINFVES